MKWREYDPTEYLDSEEMISTYLQEAEAVGDPDLIEMAAQDAARARERYQLGEPATTKNNFVSGWRRLVAGARPAGSVSV